MNRQTLADLRFLPGIIAAFAVLATVVAFVAGAFISAVVDAPGLLLLVPAGLGVAQVYIIIERGTHPHQ